MRMVNRRANNNLVKHATHIYSDRVKDVVILRDENRELPVKDSRDFYLNYS